jgi:hypothetical protein
MKPALPPLPMPTNLPFQVLGNHTSKPIAESGSGVSKPRLDQLADVRSSRRIFSVRASDAPAGGFALNSSVVIEL